MILGKIIGIIPCRMSSSRFPGKPLKKIEGIPMIEHVWRRSCQSSLLEEIYIATCDLEIMEYMNTQGANVIMTSAKHKRSTDRIAEAVEILERKKRNKIEIVVNIGGDEPLIYPQMLDQVVKPMLKDDSILTANLIYPIYSEEEFNDQNVVKVVKNKHNDILFFSRLPLPFNFSGLTEIKKYKQLSIIPFQKDFLFKYRDLSPTPCEIAESIDMMRALEHGFKIRAVETTYETYSVDTLYDYELVKKKMKQDPLFKHYCAL